MSGTAIAFSNYAAILHLNGKYEQAEVMYKKAIRINPNDAICNDNLNKLHRLMSRWSEICLHKINGFHLNLHILTP